MVVDSRSRAVEEANEREAVMLCCRRKMRRQLLQIEARDGAMSRDVMCNVNFIWSECKEVLCGQSLAGVFPATSACACQVALPQRKEKYNDFDYRHKYWINHYGSWSTSIVKH